MARCAGVQNVSRPMLRCHEISQIMPMTMQVLASANSSPGQYSALAADLSAAFEIGKSSGEPARAVGGAVDIGCCEASNDGENARNVQSRLAHTRARSAMWAQGLAAAKVAGSSGRVVAPFLESRRWHVTFLNQRWGRRRHIASRAASPVKGAFLRQVKLQTCAIGISPERPSLYFFAAVAGIPLACSSVSANALPIRANVFAQPR